MQTAKGVILIADDDPDIRLALAMLLKQAGYQTEEAANAKEIAQMVRRQKPDLVLLDMNFSRDTTSGAEGLQQLALLVAQECTVVLMTAWAKVDLAVQGMQSGAVDFIEKPWDKHRLLRIVEQQCQFAQLNLKQRSMQDLLNPKPEQWIAESAAMQSLDAMVKQIAPTDANILILGENGTGKSLLAKRIHQLSGRRLQAMIAINMAAIPSQLFESELFGHKKGAFTDAKDNRAGRFELAAGGTLFMDEIGCLPLELQPKLLRVLESGEYEVVGGSATQRANVRLISATNADLGNMVRQGQFRQDLLYRLNTFVLELPPLRQRLADIEPLALWFAKSFAHKYQKPASEFSPAALSLLRDYAWPGNIRELSHVVERAVLLCANRQIEREHILLSPTHNAPQTLIRPLEEVELEMIQQALSQCEGHVSKAAQILGISRHALYRRIEKFNLSTSMLDAEND